MIDDIAVALANRHRRRLLLTLLERDPDDAVPLAAIAAGRSDVRIELAHAHLPMLEAAGLVDWHPGAGVVRRGPRFEDCSVLLEPLRELCVRARG